MTALGRIDRPLRRWPSLGEVFPPPWMRRPVTQRKPNCSRNPEDWPGAHSVRRIFTQQHAPLYPVATDNPSWSEESESCSVELMVAAAADWEPPDASTSLLLPGRAGGSLGTPAQWESFKATAMLYMPAVCTWRRRSIGVNDHMGEECKIPLDLVLALAPTPPFRPNWPVGGNRGLLLIAVSPEEPV